MPKYVVSSASPITAREISGLHPDQGLPWPERPVDPGWGVDEGSPPPGIWPSPGHPAHPIYPTLPPRDEWPSLPPGLGPVDPGYGFPLPPSVSLPIPPTPEHPMVPVEPDPEVPEIWPPIKPEFPDLSDKTLALALVYVSRHVAKWHWVIIDHNEAKEKAKAAYDKIKSKLPAGGVGGTPPARPQPGR